jgi:hypothetical protein
VRKINGLLFFTTIPRPLLPSMKTYFNLILLPFPYSMYLLFYIQSFFECLIGTIQVILIISVSLPIMLLCMAPVVFYFWFVSKQYLKVSRDLKRLESVNKSPVYVLFSGTYVQYFINILIYFNVLIFYLLSF